MKDLRTLFVFLVATAGVIALLSGIAEMQSLPTWVLPLAALLGVVVIPLAISVMVGKRGKNAAKS